MEPKNFNEELKRIESEEAKLIQGKEEGPMKLDDTQRVKVLSPTRLVVKRFVRNKLAIVGTSILIFMFVFCFIGPLFYPYHQTEKFYKEDILENSGYASAKERTEYTPYQLIKGKSAHHSLLNMINSNIKGVMEEKNLTSLFVFDDDDNRYLLKYETENVYSLYEIASEKIGTYASFLLIGEYDSFAKQVTLAEGINLDAAFSDAVIGAVDAKKSEFEFQGETYNVESAGAKKYRIKKNTGTQIHYVGEALGEEFESAVINSLNKETFEFEGKTYSVTNIGSGAYEISQVSLGSMLYIISPYTINFYDISKELTDEFVSAALVGLSSDGNFVFGGENFSIREENEEIIIYKGETLYGVFTTFSVNRINGSSALPLEFKVSVKEKIEKMIAENKTVDTLVTKVERQNSDGQVATDENGNIIYDDTTVTITRKGEDFAISCDRIEYLIDTYSKPFSKISKQVHPIGTDGDGYDVLSRIMYGGRVSLIVGFVVVIIEIIIGVILGGVSGYFGSWIDTIIMRLVDIFNCIPSMPILIIIGAVLDKRQEDAITRLMWMMAVLGFLGWAGVARLVRGQILSLREQEFMVATEVGGLRVSRRIFRHLIPNVMPQLIVHATAGLGSIILTESVLSFLGLGVKHPLASWGSMINSVSEYHAMVNYTYIWVPVGLLICLTVIAFNFVGDGLRDAFDPKMKR